MDKSTITTKYDDVSGNFIVHFPEHTTVTKLQFWKEHFLKMLLEQEHTSHSSLLLDTNTHDFESISCMKYLRSFLQEITLMENGITKIAFVQPVQFREPEIVNSNEAYFSNFDEAYQWLSN